MAQDIEFMESFETGDTTRYASPTNISGYSSSGGRRGGKAAQNGGLEKICRPVTAQTTKFCAAAYQRNNAGFTNLSVMSFYEVAGTARHVTIGFDSTGHVTAWRGVAGSGTLLGTSSGIYWAGTTGYVHVETKCTVHSSTGVVEVRFNGVTVLNLTGQNTRNGGTVGTIDQVWLVDDFNVGTQHYDDWVISKSTGDFVGDVCVDLNVSAADGTYTNGTANTGTRTTATQTNDGDTSYVTVDNTSLPKKLTFDMGNAASNAVAVLAIAPVVIVEKDDAGANTMRVIVKSSATEVDNGADLSPTSGAYGYFPTASSTQWILQTNPNTSAAWTLSGFNAIEVGINRLT